MPASASRQHCCSERPLSRSYSDIPLIHSVYRASQVSAGAPAARGASGHAVRPLPQRLQRPCAQSGRHRLLPDSGFHRAERALPPMKAPWAGRIPLCETVMLHACRSSKRLLRHCRQRFRPPSGPLGCPRPGQTWRWAGVGLRARCALQERQHKDRCLPASSGVVRRSSDFRVLVHRAAAAGVHGFVS